MHSALTKEALDSHYSLWEMTRLGLPDDDQDFPSPSPMSHTRSISSGSSCGNQAESTSTFTGTRNHPALTRSHPSLTNRNTINPSVYLSPGSASNSSYINMPIKADSPPPSSLSPPHSADNDEEQPKTAKEKLDAKRLRNTMAARRSRHRRRIQFEKLEQDVNRLNRERDVWRERALMMQRLLLTQGLPCPNFSAD